MAQQTSPCGCDPPLNATRFRNCNNDWARAGATHTSAILRQVNAVIEQNIIGRLVIDNDVVLFDNSGTATWWFRNNGGVWAGGSIGAPNPGFGWSESPPSVNIVGFGTVVTGGTRDAGFDNYDAAVRLADANADLARDSGRYTDVDVILNAPRRPPAITWPFEVDFPARDLYPTRATPWRVRVVATERDRPQTLSEVPSNIVTQVRNALRQLADGSTQTQFTFGNVVLTRSQLQPSVTQIVGADLTLSTERIRLATLYCVNRATACTSTEERNCRSRSSSTRTFVPSFNSSTGLCECNEVVCSDANCERLIRAGTHRYDANCNCEEIPRGCTQQQRNDCAARSVDGITATFNETDCSCDTTRTGCSAAQIRALQQAATTGQELASWTWNATTSMCDGTYRDITTVDPGTGDDDDDDDDDEDDGVITIPLGGEDCTPTPTERTNCSNRTNSYQVFSFNDDCDCVPTQFACSPTEVRNCIARNTPTLGHIAEWDSSTNSCNCRSLTLGTTDRVCTDAQEQGCLALNNLPVTDPRSRYTFTFDRTDCSCDGTPKPVSTICAGVNCGSSGCPNPINNCACEPVGCPHENCSEGQLARRAADANGNFCTCECYDPPPPPEDTGGCPGCTGIWSLYNNALLNNNLYIDGVLVNVLTVCSASGATAQAGFRWDILNCCCRPVCTDPRNPVFTYDPVTNTARCGQGRVDRGCPPGQFRNADGDCIVPPPPPPPPDDDCPVGQFRNEDGECESLPTEIPVVRPPSVPDTPPPTPPCAKFRSSIDWRCIRAPSRNQSPPVVTEMCERPTSAITPFEQLDCYAKDILAFQDISEEWKLSAAIWLERNL